MTSAFSWQHSEICQMPISVEGFPDSSVGKESACNTGDPGSIPGLGKSAGEWIHWRMSSEDQHFRNQRTKMDWNG